MGLDEMDLGAEEEIKIIIDDLVRKGVLTYSNDPITGKLILKKGLHWSFEPRDRRKFHEKLDDWSHLK